MKSYRRLNEHSWLLLVVLSVVAFFTAGCSSSSSDSGGNVNPLGAYQTTNPTTGLVVDGTTTTPGAIDSPIVTVPTDGSSIDGHSNAPLLDNMHPGWQQAACLTCHNDTSRNPDHNYTDNTMCYLCHGTNGLPGFGDNIPPIISGVVATVVENAVNISWKSDEDCLSRLVLRTVGGDRMEFPVSMSYKASHKYEVTGLQASTYYNYELICTDKSGNRTTSTTFGVLAFTTLAKASTTVTSTTPVTPVPATDAFFTSVSVKANGAFKADIKVTVTTPSKFIAYFVNKATNTLAAQQALGSVPIQFATTYDGFVAGLQPLTTYIVYIEATEADLRTHKSERYQITTENF